MHGNCTVYRTMDYLSKKWAVMILFEIGRNGGWMRFSEIKGRMKQITPKVLTERLKDMEEEKLVEHRVDTSEFPVRSEYRLTEPGKALMPIIQQIKVWALTYKIDNVPCLNLDCTRCRI